MMPELCSETGTDIWRCGCDVCAPLRRMLEARRARPGAPVVVPTPEMTPEALAARQAGLTSLPPGDRE